jgi:hypothetical protein
MVNYTIEYIKARSLLLKVLRSFLVPSQLHGCFFSMSSSSESMSTLHHNESRKLTSWLDKRRHLFLLDVSHIAAIAMVASIYLVVLYKRDLLYYSIQTFKYKFRIPFSKGKHIQSYGERIERILPFAFDCQVVTSDGGIFTATTVNRSITLTGRFEPGTHSIRTSNSEILIGCHQSDAQTSITVTRKILNTGSTQEYCIAIPYDDVLGLFEGLNSEAWVITRTTIHLLRWDEEHIYEKDSLHLHESYELDKILAADPMGGSFIMRFTNFTNQVLCVDLFPNNEIQWRRICVEYSPLFSTHGFSPVMYDPVQKWFRRETTGAFGPLSYEFYLPDYMRPRSTFIDLPRSRLYCATITNKIHAVSLGIDDHGLIRVDDRSTDTSIYPPIVDPKQFLVRCSGNGEYGIIMDTSTTGRGFRCVRKDGEMVGELLSFHNGLDLCFDGQTPAIHNMPLESVPDEFYLLRPDGKLGLFVIKPDGFEKKFIINVPWPRLWMASCVTNYDGRYIIGWKNRTIFLLDVHTKQRAQYLFHVAIKGIFFDRHDLIYIHHGDPGLSVGSIKVLSRCDVKLFHMQQYTDIQVPNAPLCLFHARHRIFYTMASDSNVIRGTRIPAFHKWTPHSHKYLTTEVGEMIELLFTLWSVDEKFKGVFVLHHLYMLCNAICHSHSLFVKFIETCVLNESERPK